MSAHWSRRKFLRVSATATGGLLVNISLPVRGDTATETVGELPTKLKNPEMAPWGFVRIGPEGIVIGARGCEIGQGIKTSLPMLIAEELDVPWSMVKVEQLDYGLVAADTESGFAAPFGAQGAGGSTSIPDSWIELRKVGAQVRAMLVRAAAQRWETDPAALRTVAANVVHEDGRKLPYGELAATAATVNVPEQVELKVPGEFSIIGQPTRVADSVQIVTGGTEYGIDADVAGALTAVVERCPYFDGDIAAVDDTKARAVPGVRHIVRLPRSDSATGLTRNLAAGVAVIADDTWSALKGRRALSIEWSPGPWAGDSTAKLEARAREALAGSGSVARRDGDFATARAAAAKTVEAEYVMPFLAHATLEPQNATVRIGKDDALFFGSTQSPTSVSRMISDMTGIARQNIDIRLPRSGGGFGRRLEADFVAEAVHIAKATGETIRLMWTREDDMQHDWYRPFGVHALRATLDGKNTLTGWQHRCAATDRRFGKPGFAKAPAWIACLDPDAFPAGCVEHYEAEFMPLEFGLARGWWRGPLPSFVAFANQSFVDEVAIATGEDPLELRLKLLGEARQMDYRDHGGPKIDTGRLADVLNEAATAIGYGRKLPPGHGIGLAVHFVFGGYAAHAMEVSVTAGKPKVHRCICAVDVGQVVNPLGLEAQMMGATIDGLSTALNLKITVRDGRVVQRNFPDYPLLAMADAPDVEVRILHTVYPPSGAGEMGIPTVAPALTNAIFAATGKRIRRLPIGSQLV